MHPKILVVGCGLTGAGLLHFLRQHAPMATTTLAPKIASRSLDAVCWEASGREGGRMYTHYFPNGEWSDIGAQYLTQFSSECTDVFNYLLETHTIQPLFSASKLIAGMREEHKDIPHFIAPEGISSVVRQLVKGNADLHFGIIAKEINYDEHKKKLKVIGEVTNTGEVVEEYVDFLVITVPIPELLKLQGPLQKFIRDNLQLSAVKYSSRFALAACYENTVESKNFLDSTKWRAKYVYDDDIVRYISIENFKRTNSMELDNHDFTITVHTSIPFVKESIGKDNDELKLLLLAKVRQLLPGLPLIPLHTYLQFWDTSQVSTPLSSNKLFEVIGMEDLIGERVAESASKIVLAGDYFSNSNFEGCLKSARAAADYILSRN